MASPTLCAAEKDKEVGKDGNKCSCGLWVVVEQQQGVLSFIKDCQAPCPAGGSQEKQVLGLHCGFWQTGGSWVPQEACYNVIYVPAACLLERMPNGRAGVQLQKAELSNMLVNNSTEQIPC